MSVLDIESEYLKLVMGVRDTLYRLVLNVLHDDTEAEDVVQDLFERAWRARDAVLKNEYPRAYLCRMARNLAIDCWRQRGRHRELEAQMDFQRVVEEAHKLDCNDMAAITRAIISALPERQRIAIHMRDVEGYEMAEIAEVMECDEASVRMNISRARKSVREQLIRYINYGVK